MSTARAKSASQTLLASPGDEPADINGRRAALARRWTAFLAALCVVALIHSAIPFASVPTLGQAIWASGFAQSYVNNGWFSIYATDFGLPQPAAIAFGLSGTFVQAMLMRLTGAASIDAYTMMIVLYLAFALYGATAMARQLGASYPAGLLLGVLWLTLPIVWGHAGYSMLMLGFALLPFYLYCACTLLSDGAHAWRRGGLFVFACVLAVFMDGYTFVMFVAISAILVIASLIVARPSRRDVFFRAVPVMIGGFGLAYALYVTFLGSATFTRSGLDFFRGWAVDVRMLFEPAKTLMWLWDTLELSMPRNEKMFWGDSSAWITTFCAPLLLLGIVGFIAAKDRPRAAAFLAMALFGIYFSLGPSLKFDSRKDAEARTAADGGYLMPEKYALGPTGSAWILQNVPGFREMRASYRWIGMGALGLWALGVLLLQRLGAPRPLLAYATIVLAIVCFLPHVSERLIQATQYRNQARAIDTQLLKDIDVATGNGDRVLFVPHGNDFLVGYLAAAGGFRAFNIGGDKNMEAARATWSGPMRALDLEHSADPTTFWQNVRRVLLSGETDKVVFAYFDTLWSAHSWPPSPTSLKERRDALLPIARQAAATDCLALTDYPLFSVISRSDAGDRLAAQAKDQASQFDDAAITGISCASAAQHGESR